MAALETHVREDATEQSRFTVTIRPGVTFPDWSAVVSPRAGRALADVLEAFGAKACWDGFSAEEDFVRRAILDEYLEEGHAPPLDVLSARTALPAKTLQAVLDRLGKRDLVVLDGAGKLTGAYPLTDRETEHKVHVNGHIIHAMCAIDALGVGRMYGCDVRIESRCRASGKPIGVTTTDAGGAIGSVDPPEAVVWSGAQLKNGRPAADTLCTVIAFFASDEALEGWRQREHPDTQGHRLTIDEAAQAGGAIFGPMLAGTN